VAWSQGPRNIRQGTSPLSGRSDREEPNRGSEMQLIPVARELLSALERSHDGGRVPGQYRAYGYSAFSRTR
jgi:hypothetical protein